MEVRQSLFLCLLALSLALSLASADPRRGRVRGKGRTAEGFEETISERDEKRELIVVHYEYDKLTLVLAFVDPLAASRL